MEKIDLSKLTSDEAYALFDDIPSDGESVISEISEEEEEIESIEKNDFLRTNTQETILSDDESDFEMDVDSDDSEDNIPLIQFVNWRKQNIDPVMTNFEESTGPSSEVPADITKPIDFFLLLFDEAIGLITEQTNLYATQKKRNFTPTSKQEMKIFIAINLLMGIKKSPSFRDYWSSRPEMRDDFIASKITVNRFGSLLTSLHCNNNDMMPKKEEPGFDKLYKIRPYIELLKTNFQKYYLPSKEISIDESMVKFKGRISFKQYMPMKPIKRGFKIWACADKEGYLNNFEIYTGKHADHPETGLGERVVLDMTKGLEGKGHHAYFDNFFTTTNLLLTLQERQIYSCGTVRANRKNLPSGLKADKAMSRGDFDWSVHKGKVSCLKWKDKRTIQLLSTIHYPTDQIKVNKREKDGRVTEVNCPKAVLDYRKFMGGVDKADMMKSYYGINRKSRKWYHRLFWHFLDTSVVNSYIIFKRRTKSNMSLKTFRCEVILSLMGASVAKGSSGRPSSEKMKSRFKPYVSVDLRRDQAKHMPVHGTSRRCANCSSAQKPHRTRWSCTQCNVGLCLSAEKNCFLVYHT